MRTKWDKTVCSNEYPFSETTFDDELLRGFRKKCLKAMNRISDASRVRDYTKNFDLAQGIRVFQ